MAEYAKAFSYDARGSNVEAFQGFIDSDVAAWLTDVGATHFNDVTVAVNEENVIVFAICDDAI